MATTCVGFYRPAAGADEAVNESFRSSGTNIPAFQEKIFGFPASLPATCKLLGSWMVTGDVNPGVMVVEAESFADLQHINQYYNGWIVFDWHPTNTGGVARS